MQKVRPANWTLVTELQRALADKYGLGGSKLDINCPEVAEREMRFYAYAALSDNTHLNAGELTALEKVSEQRGLEVLLKAVNEVKAAEGEFGKVKNASFEKLRTEKTMIVKALIDAQNG